MAERYCLCGCGEMLRGKQRKFASDACRARYNRGQKKPDANRPLSSAFRPLSSGFRSVSRQITIQLSVDVALEIPGGRQDLDDYYLNRPTMYLLSLRIEDFLIEKYPDTRVLTVKVDRVGRKW